MPSKSDVDGREPRTAFSEPTRPSCSGHVPVQAYQAFFSFNNKH
jgi:hypothetical protein